MCDRREDGAKSALLMHHSRAAIQGNSDKATTDSSALDYQATLVRSYRLESCTGSMSFRHIHLFQIFPVPQIFIIPEFLTHIECQELIHLADEYWEPSLTSIGYARGPQKDYVQHCSSNRTSSSSRLPKGGCPLVSKVENRVCTITKSDWDYLEPLVVVRYYAKQYFNQHHDGFFRPITVLIYLNDEFTDGETEFVYLGMKVKPQTGMAVIWNNVNSDGTPDARLAHAGLPPSSGIKYAMNCFLNIESQNNACFILIFKVVHLGDLSTLSLCRQRCEKPYILRATRPCQEVYMVYDSVDKLVVQHSIKKFRWCVTLVCFSTVVTDYPTIGSNLFYKGYLDTPTPIGSHHLNVMKPRCNLVLCEEKTNRAEFSTVH